MTTQLTPADERIWDVFGDLFEHADEPKVLAKKVRALDRETLDQVAALAVTRVVARLAAISGRLEEELEECVSWEEVERLVSGEEQPLDEDEAA